MSDFAASSPECSQQELLLYHQIALVSMSLSKATLKSEPAVAVSFNPARALSLALGAVITGGAAFSRLVGKPLTDEACRRIAVSMVDATLLDISQGSADDFMERLCIAFQTALGAHEAAQAELASEERATATVQ